MVMHLIPKPSRCEMTGGTFRPAATLPVVLDEATRAALGAGGVESIIACAARRAGLTGSPPAGAAARVTLAIDAGLARLTDEGYTLRVRSHGIEAAAAGIAGLRYAIESIGQLLRWDGTRAMATEVPCCAIEDKPRFAWRGLMLDSSRHFQTVRTIRRVIDLMASLKLNRLHWHLTDDEAWRLQVGTWPRLTEVAAWRGDREGGSYSAADVAEVEAYAADRGIVVVPEIEMPGHCNAALHAYPELGCGGQPLPIADGGWNAYTRLAGRRVFCAGRPRVRNFLRDVLDEVGGAFRSRFVHLGGDERPAGLWSDCPDCRAAMAREGAADEGALQTSFMHEIAGHARESHGREVISWADTLTYPAAPDRIIQGWHPGQSARAARLGHRTINSNHEWTYFDYPPTREGMKQKPDWMIVLPLEKVYHFDPVPDGLEPELHDRVLGSEASMWTEYVRDEAALFAHLLPRLVAFSEALWSPRLERSYDEFRKRLAEWPAARPTSGFEVGPQVEQWRPPGRGHTTKASGHAPAVGQALPGAGVSAGIM